MSQSPAPSEIRRRILNVFPAAHYALDGLLRLLDIVLDDEVETAAVECRATPRLLLNPVFLERHCRADEHLLMVVLHEVHHVLLGHTRLFPRLTEAQNIAFDAVINAALCHMFPGEAFRSFFEKMYLADSFPGCLLRPPPGWPAKPRPPACLPHSVRELIGALYGESGVGYSDLFRAIERAAAEGLEEGDYLLIGDHGPEEGTTGRGLEAIRASALPDAIRSVVEKWPMLPEAIRGRGVGHDLRELILGNRRRVPEAVALLRRMFGSLTMDRRGGTCQSQPGYVERAAETAIPQLGDRRAVVRGLLGETPLLYRTDLASPGTQRKPGIVHVYLDVSGSTAAYQADLLEAVRPHLVRGLCKIHLFSTEVVDLPRKQLLSGNISTTGGTDIACVTGHMLENDVTRSLLLTDGFVGAVPPDDRRRLSRRRAVIDVALTPGGGRDNLEAITRKFVSLPIKGGHGEN